MSSDSNDRIRTLLEKGSLAADTADSLISDFPIEQSRDETKDPEARFEIGELLGHGNRGEVYRCFDRKLQRFVAIKFLRAEQASMMSQFLLEARTQARLDHENVAKVYEAGEWSGKSYIAMQYIQGKPLNIAAREMTLEQKVSVMIQVAEAVHAAHSIGFIHRDLKPGNVLVERTSTGWKPYVVDFGLAREADSATGTRTGVIAGSPAYMAPEQARGDIRHLDRRTDVYGLGATLFEILSGAIPFSGKTGAEVLVQVLQQDLPLLRSLDPSIPADLEAIVEKCLQKEPQMRYESALALAQDLRRYAVGESVIARRTNWAGRTLRKARKNPALTVSIAAAVVVSLILSTLWIRERWQAAERTRLAQEYTQQAGQLQAFLRYSYMLPLHDLRREQSLVLQTIRKMEQGIVKAGPLAAGPGHSAIGRAYLQLQDYNSARRHLELALQAGQHDPETSNALGRALGALYQQGLQEAARLSGKDREERKDRLNKTLRDPALRLLQNAETLELESTEYLKGLIEFYEGDHDAALKNARAAIEATPWLYEAKQLEGDILLFSGIEKRKKELWPQALSDYALAKAAYDSALQMARSDPGLLLANCERAIQEIEVTYYVQRVFPQSYKSALGVCENVLQADPNNAEAYYKLSRIHYRVGDYAYSHGLPFSIHFQNAISSGEKALALNPGNSAYYDFITAPLDRLSWYEWEHGQDPEADLSRMIHFSEKVDDHGQVAIGYLLRAEIEMATGHDPNASLDAAAGRIERVREYAPDSVEIYNLRGAVLEERARYESLQGRNPAALLDQAITNYNHVLVSNPNYPLPRLHIASAQLIRAEYEFSQNRDASAFLQPATENLQQVIKMDPYYAAAFLLMGQVCRQRALQQMRAGLAPDDSFREAENSIRQALQIQPDDASAYRMLASVFLDRAEYKRSKRGQTAEDLNAAEEVLGKAREKNSRHFELYLLLAKWDLLKFRVENAPRWKQEAKSMLQHAADLNPIHPELTALSKQIE